MDSANYDFDKFEMVKISLVLDQFQSSDFKNRKYNFENKLT